MTMSTRKFGIEIECKNASKEAVIAALREVGIECIDNTRGTHGDLHATAPTWKIVLDGSVSNGWEMVSPILSGEDGIAQVRKVARVLSQCGANADQACGLHVHIDARDLAIESIVNVARRYARFESEIDAFMPRARNRSQYCGTMRNINFDEIVSRGIGQLHYTERYHKVNLSAYARHSTIEFRHHSGTTSGEKMENWIKFCAAFVDASVVTQATAASTTPVAATAPMRVAASENDAWGGCACPDCDAARQRGLTQTTSNNSNNPPF